MSRRQVFETCRQADIGETGGLLHRQGPSSIPKGLPIINADPESLPSVIEEFIADEDLRIRKDQEGRKFVERVHDSRVVAKQLINLYLAR